MYTKINDDIHEAVHDTLKVCKWTFLLTCLAVFPQLLVRNLRKVLHSSNDGRFFCLIWAAKSALIKAVISLLNPLLVCWLPIMVELAPNGKTMTDVSTQLYEYTLPVLIAFIFSKALTACSG